jgi:hypothetical protein
VATLTTCLFRDHHRDRPGSIFGLIASLVGGFRGPTAYLPSHRNA